MTTETSRDVVIDDVSMQYPSDLGSSKYAVRSVSLRIPEHKIVCLVGPSGCGKSTLIRMIAGLERPTEGKLTLGGKAIPRKPSADRAMVFQADAVFPWMTVYDNIDYPSKIAGLSRSVRKERAGKFLDMVGLRDYARRWPRELSGGMRKRVDVARAYAADPSVLLMDEPFGALDVMTKERLQIALLELLRTEPKTTVFVTHDLEEALFLGDLVVVMQPRPGRISRIVEVPFERPRDRFLKSSPEFIALKDELSNELHASEEGSDD